MLLASSPAGAQSATHSPDAASRPATLPVISPAEQAKAANAAIAQAVALLTKEAQAWIKDPNSKLREESDFFISEENPAGLDLVGKLTNEALLAALERNIGADGRVDHYVKWQLLSGIQGRFNDPRRATRAVAIYKRIPQPQEHPGARKGNLDQMIERSKGNRQEYERLAAEWNTRVQPIRQAAQLNFEYRSALLSTLPPSPEVFDLELQDAYNRALAGWNASEFIEMINGAIRTWASQGAAAKDISKVADLVRRFKDATTGDGMKRNFQEVHQKLDWSDKDGEMFWRLEWPRLGDDDALKDLIEYLQTKADRPGLKFND